LHYKRKNWIETLALEAETAISNLDITDQQYYRQAVTKNIKKLNQQETAKNKKSRKEWKLIIDIKNKIIANKLIVSKADKGKTVVILTIEEYTGKVEKFIHDNQFVTVNSNPTQQLQKTVKQTLKQ
jgi:hypothetical protein